jgi:proliferating cell nuclear antigen PCNA
MKLSVKDKDKVCKLVTIFKNLSTLTDVVNIVFSPSKLYIQGLDSSHACLIEMSMMASWFCGYESGDMTLGVSCNMLAKVIDCWKEGHTIEMRCEGEDTLYVTFDGEGTINKEFSLPLINIERDNINVPKTDYSMDLTIKSTVFKGIFRELALFSDTVKLDCTEEIVKFLASGDSGALNVTIRDDDIEEFAIEEGFNLDVDVSTRFISTICEFHNLNEMIYIHCSHNCPIKLHYSLDDSDSSTSESYIRFFVATKIDD